MMRHSSTFIPSAFSTNNNWLPSRVRKKPHSLSPICLARRSKSPAKESSEQDEPKPVPNPPPVRDVQSAYSIGETIKESPALNSTLMNAMRDYFGDDGREVQDYMKRPRNEKGQPMFRAVLVGSGPRELLAIQKLRASGIMKGLYYCPDDERVCVIEMSKYGRSATVSAYFDEEEVVRFAKWAVADAVFVGPDRGNCIGKESETALAIAGITVFPHDVTAAIADGQLDVAECLAALVEEDDEGATAEQLVE